MKSIFVLFLFLIIIQLNVEAQNRAIKDSTYFVKLSDETTFMGTFVNSTDSTFLFQTKNTGLITVNKKSVSEMTLVDKRSIHLGHYWFENPNSTRYFFSPSAINLRSGEGYYQNIYILLNSFYVGITDYLTIGGGFEFTSLFSSGSPGPFYFLTLKGGAPVAKNLHVGAGIIYAGLPSYLSLSKDYSNFGIGFGLMTYGNRDNNITLGIGKGFENGNVAKRPFITISGMARMSKKVALVTENWMVPSKKTEDIQAYNSTYNYYYYTSKEVNTYPFVFSYGLRFFGEKLSVDLGFINSSDVSNVLFVGIPYVDFVVKF